MSKIIEELKKMDAVKLKKRLDELRVQLVEQKKSRAAGELVNPMAMRQTRRMIAASLTLLAQKEKI